jgi:hypothetical protein
MINYEKSHIFVGKSRNAIFIENRKKLKKLWAFAAQVTNTGKVSANCTINEAWKTVSQSEKTRKRQDAVSVSLTPTHFSVFYCGFCLFFESSIQLVFILTIIWLVLLCVLLRKRFWNQFIWKKVVVQCGCLFLNFSVCLVNYFIFFGRNWEVIFDDCEIVKWELLEK